MLAYLGKKLDGCMTRRLHGSLTATMHDAPCLLASTGSCESLIEPEAQRKAERWTNGAAGGRRGRLGGRGPPCSELRGPARLVSRFLLYSAPRHQPFTSSANSPPLRPAQRPSTGLAATIRSLSRHAWRASASSPTSAPPCCLRIPHLAARPLPPRRPRCLTTPMPLSAIRSCREQYDTLVAHMQRIQC